jgi:hypothetical protein
LGDIGLAALQMHAPAIGHINIYPEADGTLRRIPHLIRYREKFIRRWLWLQRRTSSAWARLKLWRGRMKSCCRQ